MSDVSLLLAKRKLALAFVLAQSLEECRDAADKMVRYASSCEFVKASLLTFQELCKYQSRYYYGFEQCDPITWKRTALSYSRLILDYLARLGDYGLFVTEYQAAEPFTTQNGVVKIAKAELLTVLVSKRMIAYLSTSPTMRGEKIRFQSVSDHVQRYESTVSRTFTNGVPFIAQVPKEGTSLAKLYLEDYQSQQHEKLSSELSDVHMLQWQKEPEWERDVHMNPNKLLILVLDTLREYNDQIMSDNLQSNE